MTTGTIILDTTTTKVDKVLAAAAAKVDRLLAADESAAQSFAGKRHERWVTILGLYRASGAKNVAQFAKVCEQSNTVAAMLGAYVRVDDAGHDLLADYCSADGVRKAAKAISEAHKAGRATPQAGDALAPVKDAQDVFLDKLRKLVKASSLSAEQIGTLLLAEADTLLLTPGDVTTGAVVVSTVAA